MSSDLLCTEFIRAVNRTGRVDSMCAQDALAAVDTLSASAELVDEAGEIGDPTLRSLDALHLATAVQLAESCTGVITYDTGLADAARAAGLEVVAPT